MRALLDVNVLIAMHDAGHSDHRRAREWFATNIEHGWASCPVTQNGFVRILSQPRYPLDISTSQAIALLGRACAAPHHEFWSDAVSLIDGSCVDATRVHGPKQVTDLYLLALAVGRDGRLVTFDERIAASAVVGAGPEHLVVL